MYEYSGSLPNVKYTGVNGKLSTIYYAIRSPTSFVLREYVLRKLSISAEGRVHLAVGVINTRASRGAPESRKGNNNRRLSQFTESASTSGKANQPKLALFFSLVN